jgi:hypothetical protein
MRLEQQLRVCGYEGDPKEFSSTLPRLLHQLYPGCTDETVLCEPQSKAIPFVEAVRAHFQCDLPESVVLKALINSRKANRRHR